MAAIQCSDPKYIKEQYAEETNLATRIRTHELYTEPRVDFTGWILEQIGWRGDERVLDAGCGAGTYVAPVLERTSHYVAGDLSPGMLRQVRTPARVNLDVQDLPFASSHFDVVLANHMIYHLPDQDRAVAGFARVLRTGGVLIAATNSAHNMQELRDLVRLAADRLHVARPVNPFPALDFTVENGAELLSRHFDRVELQKLASALVFPAAQPVLDYLATSPRFYLGLLPEEVEEGRAWQVLRDLVEAEIAHHGAFRVNKLSGVFICWNGERR
ncbi:MAG: methyltransferase domain-containing protein [Anaerolineae bacterium]|nr:methyltransferase domain-containing protein [Anaerolineae bacterium]